MTSLVDYPQSLYYLSAEFNQPRFLFSRAVPDWALHCTQNPEITVQYISDSGAVQLSRRCQDSVKEISCQGRMDQMAMYDELKCPEEQATITSTEITTVEVLSTTEESRPEVIIKNPQKMLEDIFNDVETNIELDSNRLDAADAKKELDMMVGDQPMADTTEDKKALLKLSDKKEAYPKKTKNAKKDGKVKETTPLDDTERMMGDAPADDAHDEHSTTIPSKPEGSTTDRQRRDVMETTVPVDVNISTETSASTEHSDSTTIDDLSTISTELTTEAQQVTSVITEETTTKFIVQGHPLFHSQAIFKEPISTEMNSTLERKDVSNNDDHFIPPMLLVKARFTATKSTEGATEETKEMTTDAATLALTESTSEGQTVTETFDDDKNSTSKTTESNEISTNEISSVTQLETTPALTLNEKPILIEKRNDPRLGLNAATTTSQAPLTTSIVFTTTEQSSSTTEEATSTVTEESSSISSFESSVSEISTTDSQTEMSETSESSSVEARMSSEVFTSTQPEPTAERLIESTVQSTVEVSSTPSAPQYVTPIAIKLTTIKAPETSSPIPINKSTTQMRNDIDGSHHERDESHEASHELHDNSEESESFERRHLENNLNNEDNYQPYKPNRHRTISKLDHHHGPGFSLGKILG